MTKEELIARLRSALTFKDLQFCPEAADLIETLIAERDTVISAGKILAGICHASVSRADAAEAKLAENEVRLGKAVEALTNIDALDPENLVGGCSRDALSGLVNRMGDKARAALAEIKGESHE